jgi:hypothetical protein
MEESKMGRESLKNVRSFSKSLVVKSEENTKV